MAHTRGPWRANKTQGTILADSDEGITVGGGFGPHGKANYGGYLIAESVSLVNLSVLAAAPDLLKLAVNLISLVEHMPMVDLTDARRIVAKAQE